MTLTTVPIKQGRPFLTRLKPPRVAVNIVLGVIAMLWLLPTISLAIISFRPESFFQTSGWWRVFTAPSQLTFSNYSALFDKGLAAGGLLDSLVTSLEITLPATILVVLI